MRKEIDLLKNYPKQKRNTSERALEKNEEIREIARKFDFEFFDSERKYGYGGFSYNKKFWGPVVPTFKEYWKLNSSSSILDVGCAKGFMVHDFFEQIKGINVKGIDISDYAIKNGKKEIKDRLIVGNAKNLPFEDNFFDYIISINTIHNLDLNECKKALSEIQRVSKISSFITVDAYKNEEEKKKMFEWNLTAKTIMSVNDWKKVFDETGYDGDYYWFTP
jgi:cyclopropane fatty-acyl-phospholipid synthase-like methyltransferase